MGSKHKKRKLSLTLDGEVLDSLKGNAGAFTECYGFGDQLLRRSSGTVRISISNGQAKEIMQAIELVLDGPKYPLKRGREYEGLLAFQKLLISELDRQWGVGVADL